MIKLSTKLNTARNICMTVGSLAWAFFEINLGNKTNLGKIFSFGSQDRFTVCEVLVFNKKLFLTISRTLYFDFLLKYSSSLADCSTDSFLFGISISIFRYHFPFLLFCVNSLFSSILISSLSPSLVDIESVVSKIVFDLRDYSLVAR